MNSLARRLRRSGYSLRCFRYRSTAATLASSAIELARFVQGSEANSVHYVGHSLGGLVILQMLSTESMMPPGRVVLLGTPLQGSEVVRKLVRFPRAHALLGQAADSLTRGLSPGFSHGLRDGADVREIGMIAGTRPFGLGRLLGQSAEDTDGTVALAETEAPCVSSRIALPVSHSGLLYSAEVARQVCTFLESGCFSRDIT